MARRDESEYQKAIRYVTYLEAFTAGVMVGDVSPTGEVHSRMVDGFGVGVGPDAIGAGCADALAVTLGYAAGRTVRNGQPSLPMSYRDFERAIYDATGGIDR